MQPPAGRVKTRRPDTSHQASGGLDRSATLGLPRQVRPGLACRIDGGGRPIRQALVQTFGIVKVHVVTHPGHDGRHGLMVVEIEVFVFHAAPEPFAEDVVEHPPATVHTDPDVGRLQTAGECLGGELAALVGIEDGRFPAQQGAIQRRAAEAALQARGDLPRHDIPTEPVHNCHQIDEPERHRHIRDVGAPDLIRCINHLIAQQLRIDPMARRARGRARAQHHRLDAELAHQAAHAFAIDRIPLRPEHRRHPGDAVKRGFQVLLINPAQQLQIQRIDGLGLVVIRCTVEAEERALTPKADCRMIGFEQSALVLNRNGQLFFSPTPVPSGAGQSARTVRLHAPFAPAAHGRAAGQTGCCRRRATASSIG